MLLPVECGRGVNKDLPASELPPGVWSDVRNCRGRNGLLRKRKGFKPVYTTPTATTYALLHFLTSTARFLVQAGTASVFVDDGSTRTDITGSAPTGARDDRWTGGDYNGVLILNNGVDAPFYWNGDTATNLAALTGWPAGYRADTIRPFKDYLVAGNVYDGSDTKPQMVMWSQSAEAGSLPTSWTAAATNDAGDDPFAGVGGIIDMLPLGDMNIVYGEKGRVAMRYIGGNDVFAFTRLPGNDGLLARACMVDTPKGHVFLSAGDVMLHNGGEAVSIADGVIKDWLFATLDAANAQRAFLCINRAETEVWVCFPSTGQEDCDTVAAWNWKDESWAIFTVPNLTAGQSGLISSALSTSAWSTSTDTWDTATAIWSENEAASTEERLIVATSTPYIGVANVGSLDFGSRISWYAEKTGIPLSETADVVRSISRMRPRLDAVAGSQVTVKLATTMNPDDDPTFSASSTYTQGTTNWVSQFTTAGRYGAVRIEGADDQPVAFRTYQLEVTDSGGRF